MSAFLRERLPEYLAEDPFLVRFLGIFQEQADRLREEIDGLHHQIDPAVAPGEMLRWLGHWLGLDAIDPSMPIERQRRLVQIAGSLLSRRGTSDGVRDLLEVLTDATVTVTDTGGVHPEGQSPASDPHIWIDVERTDVLTDDHLLSVVRREVPVDVPFQLRVEGRMVCPPGARWSGPGRRSERAAGRARRRRLPLQADPDPDAGATS